MRRGLISRSLVELPDAVLDARIARIRGAMRGAAYDALVLYTNNTRAAAVSWLTGFVPYWSEALLVLLRDREPVLVAALTYRVKSWIERVSRLGEVIHTPRIGLEAGRMVAATKASGAVGVVDLGGLPAGVLADLREGGAQLSLADASALFDGARAEADPAEITLAVRAASIAQQALTRASGASLARVLAAVEAHARAAGAEEVYLAAAPDLARDSRLLRVEGEASLGASFALRATVAYKGSWVRLLRTFGRSAAGEGAADLAAAVAALPSDRGFAGFSSWLVEGCRGGQPLAPLMGSQVQRANLPPRSLISVQAKFAIDGQPVLIGAPALLGAPGEAASVLVQPTMPA
jgi:hypothetical protein